MIDTTGGPSQPDRTVVIRGDRILDLGKTGKLASHLTAGWWTLQESFLSQVIPIRRMPGMTGDEVAVLLKAEHPRLPIILLTGVDFGLPETLLRMIDGYVGKGEPAAVLLTTIEQVLSRPKPKRITGPLSAQRKPA